MPIQPFFLNASKDLDDLFDVEAFEMNLETLGEFEVAEAFLDATNGAVRYVLTKGWVAHDGVVGWAEIPTETLLWAMRDTIIKCANSGEALERQELAKYRRDLDAGRIAEIEGFITYYQRMRKKANNLRFMRRVEKLMRRTLDFRLLVSDYAAGTPPAVLREHQR